MKNFFKFLFHLVLIPVLVPWYVGDKFFELIIQPWIFQKHHLDVSRWKLRIFKIARILPLVLAGIYIISRVIHFFRLAGQFGVAIQNLKYLFLIFYNDFARTANFLFEPFNHTLYYLLGNPIQFGDFFWSLYRCLVPLFFVTSLAYWWIKSNLSIKRAIKLRNQAVREVDIVGYAEKARPDEVFLGLDLNQKNRPFYARRAWLKGHIQVIGEPGSGKTESIVQPIWFQEMRRNVATFVLDGKASRRNIDRFYTIAASLAQTQDVLYFNPLDPDRSASYNPILRGSVNDVKNKLLNSLNWAAYSAASREHLDAALTVFLRTMEETGAYFNLRELLEYFQSREYIVRQMNGVKDSYIRSRLNEIYTNYSIFQNNLAFFIGILRDLHLSNYGKLLNTSDPQIEIRKIYSGHKDCYFTLPLQTEDAATRFLGQLILQDMMFTFQQIAMDIGDGSAKEGLLVIDEMARFVSPHFIKLLEICRMVGISVCYTNQSVAELEHPAVNLSRTFMDELTDHTNMVCCFQLGSPESIQMMLNRFGKIGTDGEKAASNNATLTPELLKLLKVGRCILFMRRPRFFTLLRTGYFKFDELIHFAGGEKA